MAQDFTLETEAQTRLLASKIARQIHAPAVICLDGSLGVGKSVFARAFLQSLGAVGDIPSPTFTLIQVYDGIGPEACDIWHMDAYRIETEEDAVELGLLDAFDSAVCLIEWPGKIAGLLPDHRLDVFIERTGDVDTMRKVTLDGPMGESLAL